MQSISARTLRNADWKQCYHYSSPTMKFAVFASEIPGVTITHDYPLHKGGKTRITYSVNGVKTDSPTRAVRLYNEAQKRRSGQRHAPGSPEQAKDRRKGTGL